MGHYFILLLNKKNNRIFVEFSKKPLSSERALIIVWVLAQLCVLGWVVIFGGHSNSLNDYKITLSLLF